MLLTHFHIQENKKQLQLQADNDKALLAKSSLQINLVPEASEDSRIAKLLTLMPTHSEFTDKHIERLLPLLCELSENWLVMSFLLGNNVGGDAICSH